MSDSAAMATLTRYRARADAPRASRSAFRAREGAGQRVDSAGRDDAEHEPEDETAAVTRTVSHGNGSASSRKRVAEQLERRDDGRGDQHEEPAEASVSQELVHGGDAPVGRRDGRIAPA